MSKVVIVSKASVWNKSTNQPYDGVVAALKALKDAGHMVALASNDTKPAWLAGELSFVQFVSCDYKKNTRQSGAFIKAMYSSGQRKPEDVIILGSGNEDLQMASNSKTLLLGCDWCPHMSETIRTHGVPFRNPAAIPIVVELLKNEAPLYFKYQSSFLDVYALTNAGTYGETDADRLRLVEEFKNCVKGVDPKMMKGFKLHFLSAICATPELRDAEIWGYYPSSSSTNNGEETMNVFAAAARSTFRKRLDKPLLIRHKATAARHQSGGDRNNPTSQLDSVHLNPAYQGKLGGKTVVVLDDFLNRGVSFGVSAALLKAAGAKKVICVALGKFGSGALAFDIDLDPKEIYSLMKSYRFNGSQRMVGKCSNDAHLHFCEKFKELV